MTKKVQKTLLGFNLVVFSTDGFLLLNIEY